MVGKIYWKVRGSLGFLLSVSLITLTARCDGDKPFASQLITFIIPATIEPKDSIVIIGDTLWIKVDVSDSLYDYHTNKKYKLPNFNFGQTSIVINKLVSRDLNLSYQPGAALLFSFIDKYSHITFPGETFVDIMFIYADSADKYLLSIGIVPKEIGVYCLQFLSASELNYNGVIDLGKSADGAIVIPVYNKIYFPINDGENNYELFKEHCLATYAGPQDYVGYYSEFKGTFTFRVVELE